MTKYSSDVQQALDPALLREALAGYAAANDVIEAERQATLLRMTREEALAIWRDLMTPLDQPSNAFIRQVLERFPGRIENTEEFAAIDRKLGYVQTPGTWLMEKALEQSCWS